MFRWEGDQRWVDCGRLGRDPNHLSAMSMLGHDGMLFAGTGIWDWNRARGAVLGQPAAAPTRVWRYRGGTDWDDLGQVGGGSRVLCLASFDGSLYAGIDNYGGGRCYRLDDDGWADCGSPDGRNFECLLPFGGTLYAATHGNFYLYEGGTDWRCIGHEPHNIKQVHCLQVYGSAVHAGTWPQGYVLRYEGGDRWANVGRLGIPEGLRQCNEINDLVVYNGKLYAGVIPKGQVYRYERDGQWTLLGSLASRPDWHPERPESWCRVTAFAVHQGRLFAGTGSCIGRAGDVDPDRTTGRVYALQAGQVVCDERETQPGWTHVAAVRRGKQLQLFVDGMLQGSAERDVPGSLDLTNVEPLVIGGGPGSSFFGAISDVRLFGAALTEREVKALAVHAGSSS